MDNFRIKIQHKYLLLRLIINLNKMNGFQGDFKRLDQIESFICFEDYTFFSLFNHYISKDQFGS